MGMVSSSSEINYQRYFPANSDFDALLCVYETNIYKIYLLSVAAAPRHWPRDILHSTIFFTYNNDVNIYAPDQVISYARDI